MASSTQIRRLLLATSALLPLAAMNGARAQAPNAMPTGGQVSAGQASISRSGTRTQVTQGTDRAVVDWQGFDVGRNASVNFTQPNAGSWTLNRVNAPDPSMIAGRITANGGVAIVNPSGVVFSQGAQVNVGSLIATTSNVTNQNFMAGQMTFDGRGNPGARVENHGTITVAQRGLAALVAPGVANTGTIRARLGTAILAGAETFHLDLAGDGLVSIDVTEAVRQAPGGRAAVVTNSGLIEAHGGQVVLTANAASGLVEDVVLNTGQIRADAVGDRAGRVAVSATGGNVNLAAGQVTARGGTVTITARDAAVRVGAEARVSTTSRSGGGTVQLGSADTSSVRVEGRVSARGRAAAARGGTVAIQARDRVTLASTARVDASGEAGGGTVLVGTTGIGRAQTMARVTEVQAGAVVRADAVTRGQGGTVAVNSTESTSMMGQISVRGGSLAGEGGFVEISGLSALRLNLPGVDVRAPAGRAGTLLIDPTAIVIADNGTDPVNNTPPVAGTATLAPADIKAFLEGSGSLVLQATQSITVNNAVAAGPSTVPGAQTLTLETTTSGGTGITFNAAVDLTGIGLVLNSGSTITSIAAGTISAAGVTMTAVGAVTLDGAVNAGTNALVINASGAISGTGGVSGTSLTVRGTAGGATRAGSLDLTGNNAITSLDALTSGALAFRQVGALAVTQADALTAAVSLGSDGAITGGGVVGSSLTVRGAAGGVTRAGSLDLTTGNAVTSLDALTSGALTFRQGGALIITQADAGAGAVSLGSDGAITGGGVVGSSLTVRGAAGGATRAAGLGLTTGNAVASLDALTSGALTFRQAGALIITQADASAAAVSLGSDGAITGGMVIGSSLTVGGFTGAAAQSLTLLTGNAVSGAVDIQTTGDIAFGQAGAIQIAQANAGAGAITLRSDGAITGTGGVVGASLTVGGFTGAAAQSLTLLTGNAVLGALDIQTTGDIAFGQVGALQLARADAGTGAITLRSDGAITGTGGVVGASLTIGGFTGAAAQSLTLLTGNAVSGAVDIQTTGDIAFGQVGAFQLARADAGSGAVTLRSDGAITGTGGVVGASLTVGGFTGAAAQSLALLTGNAVSGAVDIQTTGDIAFGQAGTIQIAQANAGTGAITLRSDGAITGTGGVVGASLTIGGFTGTAAQSLTLLTGNAVSGTVDIQTTGDIAFGQAGAIQIAQANAGIGAVTLRSDGAITGTGGVVGASLTVGGFTGTAAQSLTLLTGNAVSGAVDIQTTGDIAFGQVGALQLAQADAGAGAITLRSDGAITGTGGVVGASLTVGGFTGAAAQSLTLLAGNAVSGIVDIQTTGDIAFGQAGAIQIAQANTGTGAVTLRSDGAITGTGGVVGASLTAGGFTGTAAQSLTLLTGNAVSGAVDIRTTGDIAFGQVGALQLARADAGTGAITLRSDGAVTGSNLVGSSLTVAGFSGARSGAVDLSAGNAITSAVSIQAGGNLTFAQDGDILVALANAGTGAVSLRSNGSVTGTGVTGASLAIAGTTNTAAATIDLSGNAVTGAVDLQASGAVSFAQLGNISLTRAASGGAVTLRSDGTVTGGNIVATSLTVGGVSGARSGAVDLSTGNAITGAVSFRTAGNLTFAQDGDIQLALANAGTSAVSLRSNGSVTGAGVTGASLTIAGTTNTAAASIDLSGNAVTGAIDLRASGAISFVQAGSLTLTRVASGAAVTLLSDGDVQGSNISGTSLTVAGATDARAGALTLVTGNAISGAIDILTSGATSFSQSGALTLARVDAGTGAVTLRSDGAITGTGVAGSSLTIGGASLAATSVSLTDNAVTGPVDIRALNGISFSQAGSLAITRAASTLSGAIALSSDGAITGGGVVGSSLTVRGATGDRAGSLGLTTGNAISGSLDAMTSGSLSFYQAVSLQVGQADAGTGAVNLRSDGSITGSGIAGSSLTARGFGGARAGLIDLTGNAVTGDVSLTGTGSITYAQTGGFNVARANLGLGTVTLLSDGTITGGGVDAAILAVGGVSTTRAGGLDLSGSGNAVGLLNARTSGDLSFSQNGALLIAPGSGSSAGNVSLTSLAGAIGLNASLSAGNGKTLSLTSDSISLSESLIAIGGTVQLRRATAGDIVIGSTGGDTTLPPGTLATIITADRLIITTTGAITVASSIVAPAALELAGSTGVTINSGITISSLSPGLIVDASTGSLTNNGTIRGSASAAGILSNAGRIDGNATSVLQLTNLAGASIGGSATSTTGALLNSGTITGFASAGTTLSNSSSIGGNATSAGLLTNSVGGRIGGDATSTAGGITNAAMIVGAANAALDIINSGSIGTNAVAGGALTNQLGGTIGGGATATAGALMNFGTITGGATAGTTLTNSNRIGMAAISGGLLTNSGRILGSATSTGAGLINSGTIDGAALAAGALENSGGIGGGAISIGLLTNLFGGTITGDASSTAGALQNGGTITGAASAFTTFGNTGTINGAATSGADLTNGGTIGGSATSSAALTNTGGIGSDARAVGDLANRAGGTIGGFAISSAGGIDNAGRINGAATAATTLDNGGRIGGAAISTGLLTNRATGIIIGGATSSAGAIGNEGGIGGAALAATTLTSSGSIGLTAEAGGLLTNSGSIGGTATSTAAGIVNTGTIDGIATAWMTLTNSGRIGAAAHAVGLLTNQLGGDIRGEAVSSGGAIDNAGAILGLASAVTTLANTGSIGGDALAGGLLTNGLGATITGLATSTGDAIGNSGSIGLSATAATTLTNFGSIGGDALAGGLLTNGIGASITGLARSTGDAIVNSGSIGLSATAATTLANTGRIGGDALAVGLLTNGANAVITGLATSTGGAIENSGSIGLSATAAAALTNTGSIGGDALAGGLLTNGPVATITGLARSTGDAIGNSGSIGLSATAAAGLTNTGSIGGDALAGGLLTNGPGATITGLATSTGDAIVNSGSIGRTASAAAGLANTGSIGGDALAGGLLTNGIGATITGLARSTGDAIVNSGSIGLSATAAAALTNTGSIGGDALAGGLLTNGPGATIAGLATSTGNAIGNSGSIGLSATAATTLTNSGSIGGDATAAGLLVNFAGGAIGGSALSSGDALENGGRIGGTAQAQRDLTNLATGTIGSSASSITGALANAGAIGGGATAATTLDNSGSIALVALSGGLLTNAGSIGLAATSTGGALTNTGSIDLSATAAGQITNGGGIGADAVSGASVVNSGRIGGVVTAEGSVSNLAGGVINGGVIVARTGGVTNLGRIDTAGSLFVSAARDILLNGPTLAVGSMVLNTDGAIQGVGQLAATALTVRGTSGGGSRAASLDLNAPGSQVGSLDILVDGPLSFGQGAGFRIVTADAGNGAISFRTDGAVTGTGSVIGRGLTVAGFSGPAALSLDLTQAANAVGELDAQLVGALAFRDIGPLVLRRATSATDSVSITAGGDLRALGPVTAGRDLSLRSQGGSIFLLAGANLSAGQDVTLEAPGDVIQSGGGLAAARALYVTAGRDALQTGGSIFAGSLGSAGRGVSAGRDFLWNSGSLAVATIYDLRAVGALGLDVANGSVAIRGQIQSSGDLGIQVRAGSLGFEAAAARTNGNLLLSATQGLSASASTLSAGGTATVTAASGDISFASSTLQSNGALTIRMGGSFSALNAGFSTLDGLTVETGGAGRIQQTSMSASTAPAATAAAFRPLRIAVGGALDFTQNQITGDRIELVSGGHLTTAGSVFRAGTGLLLSARGGIGNPGEAETRVLALSADRFPLVVMDTRSGIFLNRLPSALTPATADSPGRSFDEQPWQLVGARRGDLFFGVNDGAPALPTNAAAGNIVLNLTAEGAPVFLLLNGGNATGRLEAGRLGIFGVPGDQLPGGRAVDLTGTLNDFDGVSAARFGGVSSLAIGVPPTGVQFFRFNNCTLTSVNCVTPVIFRIPIIPVINNVALNNELGTVDDPDVMLTNVADQDF